MCINTFLFYILYTDTNDYTTFSNRLLAEFNQTHRRHCFDVAINDDTIPEHNEYFGVVLQKAYGEHQPQVWIDPNMATVRIVDDDTDKCECSLVLFIWYF